MWRVSRSPAPSSVSLVASSPGPSLSQREGPGDEAISLAAMFVWGVYTLTLVQCSRNVGVVQSCRLEMAERLKDLSTKLSSGTGNCFK